MTNLPLAGVRVLDMGQVVSVPFCGQLLAWMGAEVILLETSKHTTTRGAPPFAYGIRSLDTSGTSNMLATSKRSCTIDVSDRRGLELARGLVMVSDVIMDNFATKTMPKLGLSYPDLRRLKPDIIAMSLGAFGRTGPLKDYIGLHSAVNLFSSVGEFTKYRPQDRPRIMGTILPDPLSGTAACLAILQALFYRKRTGKGQLIDVSMAEVFVQMIPDMVAEYNRSGRQFETLGNHDAYRAPHNVYKCKGKDAWVAIVVETEQEWRSLCSVIGETLEEDDPRFADLGNRWNHQDELDALISAWTKQHTDYEAMELLQRSGVPAAACLNGKQLLTDPHLRARKAIVTTDHPKSGRRRMTGMPWKIDAGIKRPREAPLIGEHTEAILVDLLGRSQGEIRQLREEGILE